MKEKIIFSSYLNKLRYELWGSYLYNEKDKEKKHKLILIIILYKIPFIKRYKQNKTKL